MKKLTPKQLQDLWGKHRTRVASATTVRLNETIQEQQARIARAKIDYAFFFEYYFPHYTKRKGSDVPIACAPFHITWANAIKANKKIDALLAAFRSSAKSVHSGIGIPLWLMVSGEMSYMLLCGDNETKAAKLLFGLQTELQDNARFIHDFGLQYDGSSTWQNGNFHTKQGVSFYSVGLGQSPRGLREGADRPEYILVDDADTLQRCKNKDLMNELFSWVNGTLKGCFDASDSSIERFVCANNIIHKNSLMNMLIKQAQGFQKKQAEKYNEPQNTAENEPHEASDSEEIPHEVYVSIVNATHEDGTPTWAAKTTARYWRNKKEKTPHREYEREYMNNPIQDGTIFKKEHILYGTPPALKDMDKIIGYGDLSYRATGDYKAMPVIGRKGNQFWLLDIICRQCAHSTVANWVYDRDADYRAQGAYYTEWYIEGNFIQDDFIQEFDEVGLEKGIFVPVTADKRDKGDKFLRIEALSRFFVAGKVYFDRKLEDETDFQNFLDQLFAFEKGSGAYDDGPDAFEGGIHKLNIAIKTAAFEPEVGKHEAKGW
jgi:predicted phage terminase large subunit-like protein